MTSRAGRLFTASLWALVANGVVVVGFGVVTLLWPGAEATGYVRAVGVASVGMGLFGVAIAMTGFRRREPWAWWSLWYYPVFWGIHLLASLPPGKDHVHQVVLLVVSTAALAATVGSFEF